MTEGETPKVVEVNLPLGMSKEGFESILKKAGKPSTSTGDDLIIFKEINYGNGQKLRVYRDIFKKHETFSIRRFYQDDDGEWKYGKGVTFHDEDIDEIIEGLQAMNEWLTEDRAPKARGQEDMTEQGDD